MAMQSKFNRRASRIGFGVHQTSQKLAKLAKLVDLQLLSSSRNESGPISIDTTTHSTTVVDELKNPLMGATKEFKELLTMRTENLKVHGNRRQLFSSSVSNNATNPFILQRPLAAKSTAGTSAAPLLPWANGRES